MTVPEADRFKDIRIEYRCAVFCATWLMSGVHTRTGHRSHQEAHNHQPNQPNDHPQRTQRRGRAAADDQGGVPPAQLQVSRVRVFFWLRCVCYVGVGVWIWLWFVY